MAVTTRKIVIVFATAVFTFIALPSQRRRPARTHRTDQFDGPQIGTEGVDVNLPPVPEQLPYAVCGS